jgi:hypothetical protein
MWERVEVVIEEFLHDKQCTVADGFRPEMKFVSNDANHGLCVMDLSDVHGRFIEMAVESISSTCRSGEIEFMKDGAIVLRVKDGKVVVCRLVDLHA